MYVIKREIRGLRPHAAIVKDQLAKEKRFPARPDRAASEIPVGVGVTDPGPRNDACNVRAGGA
ncbi:hypothetical protein GCM10010170_047960 [Dactylosporangium salmoneum]|uniref:Uncharacterized protein n=1 Tax=Dactylosporangium salmoneum TaxID=53361 RepID=A0ABP5TM74_9ACTN